MVSEWSWCLEVANMECNILTAATYWGEGWREFRAGENDCAVVIIATLLRSNAT